ncbi:MAG: glycosyltransferase [Alistipes sp.]|nr:glycosyltransferase [Alistipes sp.]
MANIAFLVEWFPGGGVERVIMNLAQPLADRGHKMFLFVHNLQTEKMSAVLPIEYIRIPHSALSSQNYEMVRQAIIDNHIDIFFSTGRFPKYLPKLNAEDICKLVFVLHGCPFYEKLEKWGQIIRPSKRTIGEWINRYLVNYPKFKLGYYDRKMKKRYHSIYNAVDAYGVLFEEYGKMVANEVGTPYEESKCVVLQNPIQITGGVDLSTQREKRVIFVGRLSYWDKRIDRLLSAWKLIYNDFPEWRLSIVGEGSERNTLEKYVHDNGLQRVEFLGFTPNPQNMYTTSEILCLTSTIEGCPMVLLEAQACGCATIAFDCSAGVRELLSPNWESGVYVPNGDIKAYAEALAKLMSDDNLRSKIQQNGVENAKRFSPEKSAEQYHALIEQLMQK